jgi:glycosyltransferase involved in cell wall biosynthesis
MKICHITYAFPPVGGGGTQTHNYSLARYLVDRGYDVDIIVVRPPSVSKNEVLEAADTINRGIKVHTIWYNGFPFWIFQAIKKIREIEKQGKVDIFDIHSANDVFALLLKKRPILLSLHLFELNCPGSRSAACPRPCLASLRKCWRCAGVRRYLSWRLVKWLAARRVTRFMTKYEYMKKLAVESGIREDKIEVVPFWIDIERFGEKANNHGLRIRGIKKGDKLLVHVGRLSPENGVWELLQAFGILTQKVTNAKLILVGDGILRQEMEDYCRQNHMENTVIFVGNVAREDVFRYLALADCAVSCQLYHNYNWSLLEYMCAQKPIIATNVGGTTEILKDGYNALLADVTPESLSAKMQRVLEDPQLAHRLARNALATVRRKHGFDNLKKYETLVHRLKK